MTRSSIRSSSDDLYQCAMAKAPVKTSRRAAVYRFRCVSLLAILFCVPSQFVPAPARALDFSCASTYTTTDIIGHFGNDPELYNQCERARAIGPIEQGDIEKLSVFLRANPFVRTIELASRGGSVHNAMAMGQLVRSRFIALESDPDSPSVTCASACALLLVSGAHVRSGPLGLHRPTSPDLAGLDYETAARRYASAEKKIIEYFQDMDTHIELYKLMANTPSHELLILSADDASRYIGHLPYPRTIHEWLAAKCAAGTEGARRNARLHETYNTAGVPEELPACMAREFAREQMRRAKHFRTGQ